MMAAAGEPRNATVKATRPAERPTKRKGQPIWVNDGLLQAATASVRRRRELERLRDLGSHVLDASNREPRLVCKAVVADRGGGDKGCYLDVVVGILWTRVASFQWH